MAAGDGELVAEDIEGSERAHEDEEFGDEAVEGREGRTEDEDEDGEEGEGGEFYERGRRRGSMSRVW